MGADLIVAGSAVFAQGDGAATAREMVAAAESGRGSTDQPPGMTD